MFKIPIWNLIWAHTWETKDLEFSSEIPDWFFYDLKIIWELNIKIRLIRVEWAIEVMINELKAMVEYENEVKNILIRNIPRTFKERLSSNDPDDIKAIDIRNSKIDLKEVVREEILIEIV